MTIRQPSFNTSPPVSDEVRKTTCYMCACHCGINVHLKSGKVSYIEGNRDHPVNRGVLCAKGAAGIPFLAVAEDVGSRTVVAEGTSAVTGDYVVEEVPFADDEDDVDDEAEMPPPERIFMPDRSSTLVIARLVLNIWPGPWVNTPNSLTPLYSLACCRYFQ